MHSFRKQGGQAQVEYILLIGLVSLAILGGLLAYREAVEQFICRTMAFIGGDPGQCGEPAPAPPPEPPPEPVSAPPPQPAPPRAPVTSEEFTNFFVGSWCGPPGTGWTWNVSASGSNRVVTRANSFPPTTFIVEAVGPNHFRLTNAANPREVLVYQRLSDNSFRLASPLGQGYREGVYTRC
jgi:hypothetical protein